MHWGVISSRKIENLKPYIVQNERVFAALKKISMSYWLKRFYNRFSLQSKAICLKKVILLIWIEMETRIGDLSFVNFCPVSWEHAYNNKTKCTKNVYSTVYEKCTVFFVICNHSGARYENKKNGRCSFYS